MARLKQLPVRISEFFKISPKDFAKTGVLDSYLNVDTLLFVDPFLLDYCKHPEFKDARESVLNHFSRIIVLLKHTESTAERSWRTAAQLLSFPEVPGFNLGYSKGGTRGSGIGPKTTRQILKTMKEIIKKGIEDPVIFDLIGVLEEGVGCDRISDMNCRILYPEFLRFSERLFKQFSVKTVQFKFRNQEYHLPANPFRRGAPVVLIPREILRDLPVADSWGDISYVCQTNRELRDKFNEAVGKRFGIDTRRITKAELKQVFLSRPDLFKDYIDAYKRTKAKPYDFEADPNDLFSWDLIGRDIASSHKLAFQNVSKDPTKANLNRIVDQICEKFCDLVENNGIWKDFYRDNKYNKPKHESGIQRIFYVVASCYCSQNNIDVSPESDAGTGAVDFKFSTGTSKILVEVKLSTNTRLAHALKKQVPKYEKAEDSFRSIILVAEVSEKSKSLAALMKLKKAYDDAGTRSPEVLTVNALPQTSASK